MRNKHRQSKASKNEWEGGVEHFCCSVCIDIAKKMWILLQGHTTKILQNIEKAN